MTDPIIALLIFASIAAPIVIGAYLEMGVIHQLRRERARIRLARPQH